MNSVPLIHTSWLKPFADYFADRRVSLRPYFEAASLEAEQITSGESWITKHQLYRFLNSLAEGEKMPDVGFVVGETITPDVLGSMSETMAQATTLGEVIRTFCRLINRHVEENRCWLEEGTEGDVWLFNAKTPTFPADRSIADHAGLMSMVNLARLVGGRDWYPRKLKFQSKPTSAYRKVPGLRNVEIEFDQPASGFAFPANWVLHKVQISSPPASTITEGSGLLTEDESPEERLTRLMHSILGVGGIAPTFNLIAELCHTSPRTLHRELRESGVTYQQLLDEIRLELALTLLADPESTIKEIAFELGYSGANNFIRFFQRMKGVTPAEFRRRNAVPR